MAKRKTNVAKWLEAQYLDWQRDLGERRSMADFARFLGVESTTLSNWVNGGRRPTGKYILLLASKLGPEIYDVLGMPRPDSRLQRIIANWGRIPPEGRRELERMIDAFLAANVGGSATDGDSDVGASVDGEASQGEG